MDREKVIHGLNSCGFIDGIPNTCEVTECPYREHQAGCVHELTHDAGLLIRELLPEKETHVIPLEQIQELYTYWIEDENGHVVPETILDISGKNIMTIPAVHLTNGYAPIVTKTTDGYNNKYFTGWRCWNIRPTKEEMQAEPWIETL